LGVLENVEVSRFDALHGPEDAYRLAFHRPLQVSTLEAGRRPSTLVEAAYI